MITELHKRRTILTSGTPIPTGNLVLYMRMDNSVTDETGNHTPSGTGISYANGIYSGAANEAADFQNTSSNLEYITIPDNNLLSFGNGTTDSPFSISLALKIDTASVAFDATLLYKRGDNAGVSSTNREYQVFCSGLGTLNRISFIMYDDSTGGNLFAYNDGNISVGSNQHLVITYDGSGSFSGIKIYIDGSLLSLTDNSSGSYTAMENGISDVRIGARSWDISAGNNYLDGKIDGLGIWDKELSAAEVTAIYNEQSAGNELL